MRSLIKAVSGISAVFLLATLAGFTYAHLSIRGERPMLPEIEDVLALRHELDRPVRLSWIKTASQRDPTGAIVHSVFVLEWEDGRTLLIDTGMSAEAAVEFGQPAEWALGSDPTQVGRSIDEALASARDRVVGLVFTHLHTDHTQGIELLCPSGAGPVDVFMSRAQLERPNYTTRMGLEPVQKAPCAKLVPLADEGLTPLPDLPGVGVIRAAGHTPGSQLIVAWVGKGKPQGYVFAGDAVFAFDQIEEDRPKPLVYRVMITPEADMQLGEVRRWLRVIARDHDLVVVPSHDLAHIESLELEEFFTAE
jgi:glyoxylase-like metal-dependent hydrolase (beta-lactamase superfamily II)